MADEQKGTEYKVLVPRLTDEPQVMHGEWREVDGTFSAANDVAAIKAAEKAHGPFDHGAVAVPARSWRPRTVKSEMVPRRLWS